MLQGDQVPQLIESLQNAQLESEQLTNRLQEEVELREDLERELEDTAAAAQELWESMQAVYSEAADSRAHSTANSPTSEREEWGTPPGAVTPVAGVAADSAQQQQQQPQPSIAEAAAAALATQAAAGEGHNSSSNTDPATAAGTPAVPRVLSKEAVAAVEAAAGVPSPAMHGILTPLENKLQSLSNKLVVS